MDYEYKKQWAKNNPDKVRAYRERNLSKYPGKRQIYDKERHLRLKEHKNQQSLDWQRANPEARRIIAARYSHRRRMRVRSLACYTQAEWLTLLLCTGGVCLGCGSSNDISVDHIVPLSKGGSNTIDNIQPLCLDCNKRKGTKSENFLYA